MSQATDNTIPAARCPPGWRRDPMTGRPVMPCLGRLLFPCEPSEVPHAVDISQQCQEIFGDFPVPAAVGDVILLLQTLLMNAAKAKRDHGTCLDLIDDRIVCNAVDNVLRSQSTVRVVKTAAGWEEVPDAAAAGE